MVWRVCLALGAALVAFEVASQNRSVDVVPTLSVRETWTDNVDLRPGATKQSDFVTQIVPGLGFAVRRPRVELTGSIALPVLVYANTGRENNTVRPQAHVFGRVEAVERFFFVEATTSVSQQYLSPFGARPDGLVNVTDNRYNAANYSVSPYIQRAIDANTRYSLRNDNTWTTLTDSAISSQNVYTNRLVGRVDRDPLPHGWGADVERSMYDFPDQARSQTLALARARYAFRPNSQWRLSVSGGYESNRLPLLVTDGTIYGAGVVWRPTDRTTLDAAWEQRFFGPSYRFSLNHRTRLTAWSMRASRNITSYPELLANLGVGSSVADVLNDILLSRIPDPTERARFIDSYIADRALPPVLADPIAVYAQQIYLQESVNATFGVLGVRNTVFFSVFRTTSEPIRGSEEGLPPVSVVSNDHTQTGGSVIWTHALTPTMSLSIAANLSQNEANPPFSGNSDQRSIRFFVSRPLSPRTAMFAGARWQELDSELTSGYRETAAFVGLSHAFR